MIIDSFSGASVYYLPRSGTGRSIKATVDYQKETPGISRPTGGRPHLVILVKNDPVTGISSKEIDTGGDKLQISLRYGRTVRNVRIRKILDHDHGFIKFEAF